MSSIVVVSTVGNEEQANLIARELVARRQAACVNVIPGIKSFYRWQGEICHDSELLLVVKTLAAEYEAVAATIRELHSYEVPEILSFNIVGGDPPFLEWLAASVDKDAPFEEEE
jgi:periplasmic divalent cation tolerance protein